MGMDDPDAIKEAYTLTCFLRGRWYDGIVIEGIGSCFLAAMMNMRRTVTI